jgi:DNA invertase Pin-like site-specific DNA recombinase
VLLCRRSTRASLLGRDSHRRDADRYVIQAREGGRLRWMPRPPGRGLTKAQSRRLRAAQELAESASRRLTAVISRLIEEGVSVQAIADALGVSRQSIYQRIRRHQDSAS